jgi:hypothetical protein
MCIYCHTNHYRKIYENHYGKIPKDDFNRSYEIHHVDGDHSNNDPKNLKAVTIQEHYDIHLSQKDFGACLLIGKRMAFTPSELSNIARSAVVTPEVREKISTGLKQYFKDNPQARSNEWKENHSKWNSEFWTAEKRAEHGKLTKGNKGGATSKNTVNVTDKYGNSKRISKATYDAMIRPDDITEWEFVSVTSSESKRRKDTYLRTVT